MALNSKAHLRAESAPTETRLSGESKKLYESRLYTPNVRIYSDNSGTDAAIRAADGLMNTLLGSSAVASRLLEKEKRQQHEDALERAYRGEFGEITPGTLGITFREEQQKALSYVKGENDAREAWNTLQPAAQEKTIELLNDNTLTPAEQAVKMREWLKGQINNSVTVDNDNHYKSAKLRQMYEYSNQLQSQFMNQSLQKNFTERKTNLTQHCVTGLGDYWAANKENNPHDTAAYYTASYQKLVEEVKGQALPKSEAVAIMRVGIKRLAASGDENASIVLRQMRDMDTGDGKTFGVMGIITDDDINDAETSVLRKIGIKEKNTQIAREKARDEFTKQAFQLQDILDKNIPGEDRDRAINDITAMKQTILEADLDANQRINLMGMINALEADATGNSYPIIDDDRLERIRDLLYRGREAEAVRLWQLDPMVSFSRSDKRDLYPRLLRASMGMEKSQKEASLDAFTADLIEKVDVGALISQTHSQADLENMSINGNSNVQHEADRKITAAFKAEIARLEAQGIDLSTPEGQTQLQKNLEARLPFKNAINRGDNIWEKREKMFDNFGKTLEQLGAVTMDNVAPLRKIMEQANSVDRQEMLKELKGRMDGRVYRHLEGVLAKSTAEAPQGKTIVNNIAEIKTYWGDAAKTMPDVFLGNPIVPLENHIVRVMRDKKPMVIKGHEVKKTDKIMSPAIDPDSNYLLREARNGSRIAKGKELSENEFHKLNLDGAPPLNPAKPYYNQTTRNDMDMADVFRNPDLDGRLYLDFSDERIPKEKHLMLVSMHNSPGFKLVPASTKLDPRDRIRINAFAPDKMLPVKVGGNYTAMSLRDIYTEVYLKQPKATMGNIELTSERTLDQMTAEERVKIINGG